MRPGLPPPASSCPGSRSNTEPSRNLREIFPERDTQKYTGRIMSLTYVIISLFRGDDIEQTEYLIGQLLSLSSQPRPILVFNGGYQPREQLQLHR